MAYGFEFKRSDGNVYLDSTESAIRLVKTIDVSRTFSGNISVPEFSELKGSFFLKPVLIAYQYVNEQIVPYNQNPFPASQYTYSIYWTTGQYQRPTLSWSESNKTMSVTAAPAWNISPEVAADFQIKFFHYI